MKIPKPTKASKRSPEELALLEKLRAKWTEAIKDLTQPVPLEMPPDREVTHRINLIEPGKIYRNRPPKCADAYRPRLLEKIQRYVKAGWWVPCSAPSAPPMLVLPKSNDGIRTVVDARERNDNTIKDVTPLPDQDMIRNAVAACMYRTKLDMSDAYEQIKIHKDDVLKTAFSTVFGIFYSTVVQQGDCNAPSSFQRLMTTILRDFIGKFVEVYFDDIFIYSNSIEEHEEHLRLVFERLRKARLFLSAKKVDLYSLSMDCLGAVIDDDGIHADDEKLSKIKEWRAPRSAKEVQRFLGLVQYIGQFMPNLASYTTPISALAKKNRRFIWTPLHDHCLESIKGLACRTPILRPINPSSDEPIWVVTDASVSGIGGYYGQGKTWQTMRPAGFHSRKFIPAQVNYATHEQEILAVIETLMKYEDKLLGRKFVVVTDHRSLEFFKTQRDLSRRQVRWSEYLGRFDFRFQYIEGKTNIVSDALSRYHEEDGADDVVPTSEYVNADRRLDREGEDLPRAAAVTRSQQKAIERVEQRVLDSEIINPSDEPEPLAEAVPAVAHVEEIDPDQLLSHIRVLSSEDKLLARVLENPGHHKNFVVKGGVVHIKIGDDLPLCIPEGTFKSRRVAEILIDHGHRAVGHLGARKTAEYVRKTYWWPTLVRDIARFCLTCGHCHMSKPTNQKPSGLLHSLPIPTRPWESIAMDFVGPLPKSNGYDYLLLIIDRFSSMVHLIPTKTTVTATDVAVKYINEIVRLHGVPRTIVSDRDPKFISQFWQELHRLLGTRLLMSSGYHPQTDGSSERANRTAIQILRAVIDSDQKDWATRLPLVEFAMNAAVSSTLKMSPFEINYGWRPSLNNLGAAEESTFPGVEKFAEQAKSNLLAAHDALITSRIPQTYYANKSRQEDPPISIGDKVYLSTADLNIPKGRARKLVPKFIGPYEVLRVIAGKSAYELKLPPELERQRIHPVFHITKLRPYTPNDDDLFPGREARKFYDFGNDPDDEWVVSAITDHSWIGRAKDPIFRIQWEYGDVTWQPLSEVQELKALEGYLELMGVDSPHELPKKPRRN